MSAPMPVPGQNPALDAESRVGILLGTSIAFVTLSSIVVLLRLYTRYSIVNSVGYDDSTILFAVLLSVGVSITTIIQASNGLGRHMWMTDEKSSMVQLKALYAGEVLYNLSQIIIKISFILLYMRIFKDKLTRRVCLCLLIFLGIWGFTQEFLVSFACTPVSLFIPSRQGHCIDTIVVWYLTSVVNIVTDFLIFTTPLPAIMKLQLRPKQKIILTAIFCLGFFTCIISIIRLFFLRAGIDTKDPTWDHVPVSYWSVIELNCGIICSSIATLRPMFRKIVPGLTSPGTRAARKLESDPVSLPTMTSDGAPHGGHPRSDLEGGSQEGLREKPPLTREPDSQESMMWPIQGPMVPTNGYWGNRR